MISYSYQPKEKKKEVALMLSELPSFIQHNDVDIWSLNSLQMAL